jgi:hypothetical protein
VIDLLVGVLEHPISSQWLSGVWVYIESWKVAAGNIDSDPMTCLELITGWI